MNKLTIRGKQMDTARTPGVASLYMHTYVEAYPDQGAKMIDILSAAAAFMQSYSATSVVGEGEEREQHYWAKLPRLESEVYAVRKGGVTTITRSTGEKLVVQAPVTGRKSVGYGWNTWTFKYEGDPSILNDVAGHFWGQISAGYGVGGTDKWTDTEVVWSQSASCD